MRIEDTMNVRCGRYAAVWSYDFFMSGAEGGRVLFILLFVNDLSMKDGHLILVSFQDLCAFFVSL